MKDQNLIENNTEPKSWLQSLKEESWEAELLVSAIAIFGTFQLFDIIKWGTNFFIDVLNPDQYLIGYFIIAIGLLAISILASMFLIHFFLRAYWIGLVGLNSVFPDYSIEDSAYSKIYTKKILEGLPKLKDSIQKVDELCSVIFSAAFTILLMYAYMSIFVSIYLLVFNLLSEYVHTIVLLIPAFIIVFFLLVQFVITFISNLKSNKEKEKLQILSYKVNSFVSKILYGPFYKLILQVSMIFGSNFKKKKALIYLVLSFLFVGIFVFGNQIFKTNIFYLVAHKKYFNSTKIYSSFYKNDNKNNDFLLTPEIASDQIASKVLKVFIPTFKHEENIQIKFCGEYEGDSEKSFELRRKENSNHLLKCYKDYYKVYINGKKVDVDFLRQNKHARTAQKGVISYVDISNLKKGLQNLEIRKEYKETKISKWNIPFYKNED